MTPTEELREKLTEAGFHWHKSFLVGNEDISTLVDLGDCGYVLVRECEGGTFVLCFYDSLSISDVMRINEAIKRINDDAAKLRETIENLIGCVKELGIEVDA